MGGGGRKALAVGVLAGTAVATAALGRAFGLAGRLGVNTHGLTAMLVYARKWAAVFQVPLDYVLTVMRVETDFTANDVNPETQATGVMQVLPETAQGVAAALAKNADPQVKQTMAKWQGSAAALLDPDVGTLFGVYYLSKLYKEFYGDFKMVVASYQSGPGHLQKALAEGKPFDAYLGPKAHEYIARALQYRDLFSAYA